MLEGTIPGEKQIFLVWKHSDRLMKMILCWRLWNNLKLPTKADLCLQTVSVFLLLVLNGVALLLGQTLLIAAKSHLLGDRSSAPWIFSVPWLSEEASRASQDCLSQTEEDANGKCSNPRETGRTDLLQSKQILFISKIVVRFIHTVTEGSERFPLIYGKEMRLTWMQCKSK